MRTAHKTRAGFTVLEMTVATVVFAIFVVQFAGIWTSSEMQLNYVLNRARISREAAITRTLLLTDLSSATAVSLADSPDTGFIIRRIDGSSITYVTSEFGVAHATYTALMRRDTANNSSMMAAKLIKTLTPSLDAGGANINIVFAKSSSEITLAVRRDLVINTTP